MKNELIKINEIPLPKQMRDSHIPQVGDIYIYNYDHSIIRILSKVDGYNSYHYELWSFSQNKWIPSESVSSVENGYYTLLLHPFEEVLKMCNECFDNPRVKPVVMLNANGEFEMEFESSAEAARHIGGNGSNVWAVCNKRAQSHKGKIFVYKDEWLIKEGYFNKEYLKQ